MQGANHFHHTRILMAVAGEFAAPTANKTAK
jgi:hypothetical protein